MPGQKNMISKKGFAVHAFTRIIIMIILFFVVFNAGKLVAKSLFGKPQYFNDFVSNLNKEELGSRQMLITLDKESAVVGFSKSGNYECYDCGIGIQSNHLDAKFERPSADECKDSSCVCLCQNVMVADKGSSEPISISCEKLTCEKLNYEVYPEIHLNEAYLNKYKQGAAGSGYDIRSYWKGGFFYSRGLGDGYQLLNGLPLNTELSMTARLEKKNLNGNVHIGLCPELPCIQEDKYPLNQK